MIVVKVTLSMEANFRDTTDAPLFLAALFALLDLVTASY
jgi:hypothetical protein